MRPFLSAFLFIVLPLMLSCKETAPKEVTCGCNGPNDKQFFKVQARYLGKEKFKIQQMNDTLLVETEVSACSVNGAWTVSADPSKPNYILSGNSKKFPCELGYTDYFLVRDFEITSIEKM